MKVVIVSYYYDEKLENEEAHLQQNYTITGWAEALVRKGIEVIVINRFYRSNTFKKNNVLYLFYKDKFGGTFRTWQIPYPFLKKIKALNADIVHLHHLTLSLQTLLLRLLLNKHTAIIIQHHGGKAPGKIKRFIHNTIHYAADAFFFTSIAQGKEWFTGQSQYHKVLPVMEGATFFNYTDRDKTRNNSYYNRQLARKETGITGNPVFLWVGRLDDNKDPITILNGFEKILAVFKQATLYMIYGDNKLLDLVRERCAGSLLLQSRVFLKGIISHNLMEMYYNSADYFVLGSHYEGSGYALSEALRCGCVPIVTDIPSFRVMTDNGKLGALWPSGNADLLVKAVHTALDKSLQDEATTCINFYNAALSFDAIAEKAITHYHQVITKRKKIMPALLNA